MKRISGFTLVELAIVITIIGLLIGGVMKGQELLEDAKITQTGMQIKSIDVAGATFRNTYRDLPGDMPRPGERLKNCTGTCATAGNGNNWIGYVDGQTVTQYGATGEQNTFWYHLQAAGLASLPAPDASGYIYLQPHMGSSNSFLQVQGWPYGSNLDSTNWFYLGWKKPANAPGTDIEIRKLGKYDEKYDDGNPWTGEVFINSGNACGSSLTPTSAKVYSSDDRTACLLQIRGHF